MNKKQIGRTRLTGEEVNNRILEISNGKIYMARISDYTDVSEPQWFIDNTYGDGFGFYSTPRGPMRGSGCHLYIGRKVTDGKSCFTAEQLEKEASKYTTKADFWERARKQYRAASRMGILEKITSHMRRIGDRRHRYVYALENIESTAVYIGLSYNVENRLKQHHDRGRPYVKDFLSEGYKTKIIGLFDADTASDIERLTVDRYKDCGWRVINKLPAGTLGGQAIIWTKETVALEAKKYTRRSYFKNGSSGAYRAARKLGIYQEVTSHMEHHFNCKY